VLVVKPVVPKGSGDGHGLAPSVLVVSKNEGSVAHHW
jgi:hypothetical protein